ncbi:MAG: GNAT family N-acetyltransferase [Clostridia bacterium]|nr:GNAT family N-acetyltransferase [Clostridia bacterium]
MHIVCNDNELSIRYLEKSDDDFKLIWTWLNNENVYAFYGDSGEKQFDFVKEKYGKKIDDETQFPCIIVFNGGPIGYIQFFEVTGDNYDLSSEQMSKLCNYTDKVIGIDLFIGEDNFRDKGIGSRVLKLLTSTLFKRYGADVIVIDPKTNNPRAIACYKKCGFKECFIAPKREEKDGVFYDNIIMKIDQED